MAATPPVRRRLGVGLLVAAAVVALGGVGLGQRSPAPTSAARVTLAVPPTTVPPRSGGAAAPATTLATVSPATTTVTRPSTTASTTTSTASTTTTLPPSPLSSLLGEPGSALPVSPVAPVAPVAVSFDALRLSDFPVRDVGVAPDGQLEVPDENEIGWYRLGSSPGRPGATVLAAHVSWQGADGPFLGLAGVEPGATLLLDLADGTTREYQVVERAQYGKLMLPRDRIWDRGGPETLVLITCGGAFNADIRRYADNVVLYAVPVG